MNFLQLQQHFKHLLIIYIVLDNVILLVLVLFWLNKFNDPTICVGFLLDINPCFLGFRQCHFGYFWYNGLWYKYNKFGITGYFYYHRLWYNKLLLLMTCFGYFLYNRLWYNICVIIGFFWYNRL